MIGLFLLNGSLYSITSLLYEHENEMLTELCCVNKEKDDTCRAKCFLDKTKESDENEKSIQTKNTIVYIEQVEQFDQSTLLVEPTVKHTFFYSDELAHLFLENPLRPPSTSV